MISAMYFGKYVFNCTYSRFLAHFKSFYCLTSRIFSKLSISRQFIKKEENFVSILLDLPENHGQILYLPNFMSLKCSYPYDIFSTDMY